MLSSVIIKMQKYHNPQGAEMAQKQANRVKYIHWFACRN
jgi:hypothetical protein